MTDEEPDRALADQPVGPEFSAEARARALSRLRDAHPVVPLRSRRRARTTWWAAAAAVVVLTGVAQTRTGKQLAQLQETVTETWVPHERSLEWVKVSTVTGRTQWLIGNDELVRREGDGGLRSAPGRTSERRPCGDYPSANGELGAPAQPCEEREGDWYTPMPRFLAGLPDEPEPLYRRLRADAGDGGPVEMLRMARGVLTSGAPPEVRASVYRALMSMPELDVTADAVNLDGRRGVALGVTAGVARQEIVIDPGSGRLIGERFVLAAPGTGPWQGLPAGTVAEYTAVTTGEVAGPADRVPGP